MSNSKQIGPSDRFIGKVRMVEKVHTEELRNTEERGPTAFNLAAFFNVPADNLDNIFFLRSTPTSYSESHA